MAERDIIGCIEEGTYRVSAPNPHVDLAGTFPAGYPVARTFADGIADADETAITVYDASSHLNWASYTGAVFSSGTPDVIDLTGASLLASAGTLSADMLVVVLCIDPVVDVPDDLNPRLRNAGAWVASGDAALLDVGTSAGTVAAGDDSRFDGGGWTDGELITDWIDTVQAPGTTSGTTALPYTSGHSAELTLGGNHTLNITGTAPGAGEELNGAITISSGGFTPSDIQFNGVSMGATAGLFPNTSTYRVAWFASANFSGFTVAELT
jgi:hypothetical protein